MKIGSGSGIGGRTYFLNSIDPNDPHRRKDMIQDGEAYGLVRYSPIRCYTPKDLEQPHLRQFLEAKPADDPMPEKNCWADRRGAEYFSPLTVTDPDKVVSISCTPTGCFASFDFDGRGASLHIVNDRLARWPEIVNPVRDLLRSFIVKDAIPGAHAPASTNSSR